jgi:hypothetical protein
MVSKCFRSDAIAVVRLGQGSAGAPERDRLVAELKETKDELDK